MNTPAMNHQRRAHHWIFPFLFFLGMVSLPIGARAQVFSNVAWGLRERYDGNYQVVRVDTSGGAFGKIWAYDIIRDKDSVLNNAERLGATKLRTFDFDSQGRVVDGDEVFLFPQEDSFTQFLRNTPDLRLNPDPSGPPFLPPQPIPNDVTIGSSLGGTRNPPITINGRNAPSGNRQSGNVDLRQVKPDTFEKLGNVFLALIKYLLAIIAWVLGTLLALAGMFTDFILSIRQMAGAETVIREWRFVRDSLNFVFILVLLAIAFSTIANIEDYGMRRLLPRLIIAALLVNFSLAIAGAFLQTANVLKDAALRGVQSENCKLVQGASRTSVGTSLTCALAQTANIQTHYRFSESSIMNFFGIPVSTFDLQGGLTQPLKDISEKKFTAYLGTVLDSVIAVFFIGLFTVAMIALCAMLGVRVAVLLILLVLSPVPFVFSVIPRASEYANKWWQTFIQYTFFLPAVVFFLVIAVRIVNSGQGFLEQNELFADQRVFGALTTSTIGGASVNVAVRIFSTFLVSAFIIVALVVARTMGIYGADATLRFARRTVGGGARLAALPARVAGRGAAGVGKAAARGTGLTGLYRGVTGGRQARQQLKEEKVATGRAASAGARIGTLGGGPAYERYLNQQAAEFAKGLERDNVGQEETVGKDGKGGLLRTGTEVQKRGAAMHAQKKEYFDKAADYEDALKAVPAGSSVHKDIKKAYDKYNPILSASKGKLKEDNIKNYDAWAVSPFDEDSTKVRGAIDANREDIQRALNKASGDDVAKWSGQLVSAILQGGNTEKLDVGVDKVNAILRRGRQDAKEEIVDAYNKQTGKTTNLPKKGPGETLTGPEIKAIGKIVT